MAISPEQQKTINAVRFALRANGISAAAQAAFRQQAAQIFSPARDTRQPTDTKSKEPDRVVLTPDQIKAGEYGELIDNIKKDPRFAELFKGKAPDPAMIDNILSSTKPPATATPTPVAAANKPWAAADWIQQKSQGFQRDTKLAQALSPKPKERPYRLDIKGDKVQSMQLPGYAQSQPPSTPQASVAPAPAATRAKRQPKKSPDVAQVITTRTTRYK